jgi:tetratricopeptide (TPR) repeat protein
VPIGNLRQESFPHLHPDHTLEFALRRIAASGLPELPVVNRVNVGMVLGSVSVEDAMAAYRRDSAVEGTVESVSAVPMRLIMRAGAALVAVVLLAGFLNYFFRGERTARAQSYFAAGNRLAAANRYEEAIEQYRNALSVSHSVEHRQALGMALLKAGHWGEAAIYLKRVLRDRPQSAVVYSALGEAQLHMGDSTAARESFHKAEQFGH